LIIERGRLVATVAVDQLPDSGALEQLYLELTGRDEP
jgi:hypothetical protein